MRQISLYDYHHNPLKGYSSTINRAIPPSKRGFKKIGRLNVYFISEKIINL